MIRLMFRLAVAAFIANALWRLGSEYLVHYQFRDEVRHEAVQRAVPTEALRQRVLDIAAVYDVPLADEDLIIRGEGRQTLVEGSYVKQIMLVPGFEIPWRFTWAVDAYLATLPANR